LTSHHRRDLIIFLSLSLAFSAMRLCDQQLLKVTFVEISHFIEHLTDVFFHCAKTNKLFNIVQTLNDQVFYIYLG